MMNATARFQVVEVPDGYAVKDTALAAGGSGIWSKTYIRLGWAVRAAVRLQESFGNRKFY